MVNHSCTALGAYVATPTCPVRWQVGYPTLRAYIFGTGFLTEPDLVYDANHTRRDVTFQDTFGLQQDIRKSDERHVDRKHDTTLDKDAL